MLITIHFLYQCPWKTFEFELSSSIYEKVVRQGTKEQRKLVRVTRNSIYRVF